MSTQDPNTPAWKANPDHWTFVPHGDEWNLIANDGSVRAAIWFQPKGLCNWCLWDERGHCLGSGKRYDPLGLTLWHVSHEVRADLKGEIQ